jgi:cytochrome subunit of sulfide dehydrogenase
MRWLAVEMRDLRLGERSLGAIARNRNASSIAAALLLLQLALHLGPAAATAADQGRQLAAMCASCHRLDGSDKGIPTIVGIDEKKLAAALLAYRASESPSHIMHAVALSLSDEEIASVAHYLAEQGKYQP